MGQIGWNNEKVRRRNGDKQGGREGEEDSQTDEQTQEPLFCHPSLPLPRDSIVTAVGAGVGRETVTGVG